MVAAYVYILQYSKHFWHVVSSARPVRPELNQALLTVSDLDASRSFYEEVIGLEPLKIQNGAIEYASGDSTLVLESDFPDKVRRDFGLREPDDSRGKGVIIRIAVESVEDVESVFMRAKNSNSMVRMEPTNVSWGRKMLLLADPDDYTVEVSTDIQ